MRRITILATARGTARLHYLGVSPKRYLWLRRMDLARRTLRRADGEDRHRDRFGLRVLGAGSLFGESPSTALRVCQEISESTCERVENRFTTVFLYHIL